MSNGKPNHGFMILKMTLNNVYIYEHLRGPPGLANGKPEQCQNAPVGPLKDVFTNHLWDS